MKNQRNIGRSILIVISITLALLTIPFLAMQFGDEVNWSPGDFIIMGILIFITGLSYVMMSRTAGNLSYRFAFGLAIGATFIMIWANLAVGLIGGGPHLGNLMYIGVIAVLIAGMLLSRFTARGMELGMYATVLALVVHTIIALLLNMQNYPANSVGEIIAVNGFFAMLYLISGFLFRSVNRAGSVAGPA